MPIQPCPATKPSPVRGGARFAHWRSSRPWWVVCLLPLAFVHVTEGASAPPRWPSVELPSGVLAFTLAEELTSNGVPMRVQGFTTEQDVGPLCAWFRAHLGEPLMQDRVQGRTVLGKPMGDDHYLTVEMQRVDGLTQATVALSDLRRGMALRDVSNESRLRWQRDLPAGTEIAQWMSSTDQGRASVTLVAHNHQTDAVNLAWASLALQRRGFEAGPALPLGEAAPREGGGTRAPGHLALFTSRGQEATLAVFHEPSGASVIVVNTQAQVASAVTPEVRP